jgi:hypothetical protein
LGQHGNWSFEQSVSGGIERFLLKITPVMPEMLLGLGGMIAWL